MSKQHTQSNLFLIRLWVDPEGNGQGEWHGKVQQMNSSQASSFEDWASLKRVLANMLNVESGDSECDQSEVVHEAQTSDYPRIFP